MRTIEIYIFPRTNKYSEALESMRIWNSQFNVLDELMPRLTSQLFDFVLRFNDQENFILEIIISKFKSRYDN